MTPGHGCHSAVGRRITGDFGVVTSDKFEPQRVGPDEVPTRRKPWEGILYRELLAWPSYPNWQRKRIQNPYSVSSNLTEGTR